MIYMIFVYVCTCVYVHVYVWLCLSILFSTYSSHLLPYTPLYPPLPPSGLLIFNLLFLYILVLNGLSRCPNHTNYTIYTNYTINCHTCPS